VSEQGEIREFTLTGTGEIELSGTGQFVRGPDGVIRVHEVEPPQEVEG